MVNLGLSITYHDQNHLDPLSGFGPYSGYVIGKILVEVKDGKDLAYFYLDYFSRDLRILYEMYVGRSVIAEFLAFPETCKEIIKKDC